MDVLAVLVVTRVHHALGNSLLGLGGLKDHEMMEVWVWSALHKQSACPAVY